ncbi:hypothetical protein C0971_18195 (plasmid) [Bacillus methanolicus]|uniref:IS3 family transposase n=1 Tax=Bacillus methanolicus TaxID=1471 RepID=UPI0024B0711D|nr:IS3 family transposase [Bacillus methanolicus]UQD53897.1 hypothetical protein C0971_18195 [Bacillus methanolicus]
MRRLHVEKQRRYEEDFKKYIEFRQLYRSSKVMKKINHEGMEVSQKTISRIMKDEGMKSRTVKKHNHAVHENVLNQILPLRSQMKCG